MTGKEMNVYEAHHYGIVDVITSDGELDSTLRSELNEILKSNRDAQASFKLLWNGLLDQSLCQDSNVSQVSAMMRVGANAQVGMSCFLQKERPFWSFEVSPRFSIRSPIARKSGKQTG